MKHTCTVMQLPQGKWQATHKSIPLGNVVATGWTRDEAVGKLQAEMQYRIELSPCSGAHGDTVELVVTNEPKLSGSSK